MTGCPLGHLAHHKTFNATSPSVYCPVDVEAAALANGEHSRDVITARAEGLACCSAGVANRDCAKVTWAMRSLGGGSALRGH